MNNDNFDRRRPYFMFDRPDRDDDCNFEKDTAVSDSIAAKGKEPFMRRVLNDSDIAQLEYVESLSCVFPDSTHVLTLCLDLNLEAGNVERAKEYYERIKEISSEKYDKKTLNSVIEFELSAPDLNEMSIRKYAAILRDKYPDDETGYLQEAFLEEELGDIKNACKKLEAAVSAVENCMCASLMLARLYLLQREYSKCKSTLTRVLDLTVFNKAETESKLLLYSVMAEEGEILYSVPKDKTINPDVLLKCVRSYENLRSTYSDYYDRYEKRKIDRQIQYLKVILDAYGK